MLKSLMPQLPVAQDADHPVLRYIFRRQEPLTSPRLRIARAALIVFAIALVVVFSYQSATNFGARPPRSLHVLYWPLVLAGVLTGLAAMTMTSSAISLEKTLGTWDSLRITTDGARLTFQARWLGVFYRLRGSLGLLMLLRGLFVLGALIDLARYYQGHYLDLLLSGITPSVPTVIGALLLAATFVAALLQPVVAVGLDAAVGLLLSVAVRAPRLNVVVRVLLAGGRIAAALLALIVGGQAFTAQPWMSPAGAWGGVLAMSLIGDQGLRLLSLDESGMLWADVPYSLLIGAVLLLLTLLQAWLAGAIFTWAARLAERAE